MTIRIGESIFYDLEKEDGSALTDEESAHYEIRNLKNEVLWEGDLDKTDDHFELRLKKEDTDVIPTGQYVLLVRFENSDTGYSDYILDEPLKVIK